MVVVPWTIQWDFRSKVRCMSRLRGPIPMWMKRLLVWNLMRQVFIIRVCWGIRSINTPSFCFPKRFLQISGGTRTTCSRRCWMHEVLWWRRKIWDRWQRCGEEVRCSKILSWFFGKVRLCTVCIRAGKYLLLLIISICIATFHYFRIWSHITN